MTTGSVDLGLFGADSIAWMIHSSSSGWVGGIRALLLQALDPRAMAGVAQFSRFRDDVWNRFVNTSDFVMTITYRSKAEAEQAIAKVRSVHEPIAGIDQITGRYFSANDPQLLAYVHNCLVDSLLQAYLTIMSPLDKNHCDRYVSEMAMVAQMLGADMAEVPLSQLELSEWLMSAQGLMLTPEAGLAAQSLKEINLPRAVLPLWGIAWEAAIAMLPRFAAELYGFGIDPGRAVLAEQAARVLTRVSKYVLPSHPYYREAKFMYYEKYSRSEVESSRISKGSVATSVLHIGHLGR